MTRRRFRTITAAALLFLAAVTAAAAATRYDPRLRFRTISTPRFDIHFPQGLEPLARRLAGFIEAAAADVDRAIGAGAGRVQVILVDQHDLSNGWATPLPYNTIELSTAAPAAESTIGNTEDWLRLVFIHEYTHIAHLSRAGGWIGGLRRGFGRLPLLFPNLYQPIWGIEGMATWRESAATGSGRVPAGDFRLLLDRAAAANRFEPIDRANGGNVDWPAGATPYLYGAYFHQYLSDKYGPDSLRALAGETSRRVPYFTSRAYKRVFGRSLGQLWTDFGNATREAAADIELRSQAVRVTHHGFNVSSPRFAEDGRIYYSAIDPHQFPALMEVAREKSAPRQVARKYLGNRIAIAGGDLLLVDEIELVRSVALQSDLYLIDRRTGERSRVTREARALDPDVSSNGVVACVVQRSEGRALATFPLPAAGVEAAPQILVDQSSVNFSGPRWSPDGRLIAAERRRVGGPTEIVVINPADGSVRALVTLRGGRSGSPVWTPDGKRILFSSAVDGQPFRIYAVEVATGERFLLEGTGPSAESPDISPDGSTLIFVGYTPDGFDLFSLSLAGATWTPAAAASGRADSSPGDGASQTPPIASATTAVAYAPWRTLLPRFWTPTIESDSDELVIGAATASLDALGRHAYGIEAGWSSRARPDWRIAYAYDRWRPMFFAVVSDDTDPFRDGDVRTTEAEAGLFFRAATVRAAHTAIATYHLGRDRFDCVECTPDRRLAFQRASVRTGWQFDSSNTFGYSISAEGGVRINATAELTRSALGADGNGFAATVDLRRYWTVVPRHGIVAFRAAAARSWGDEAAERLFSASGHGPQSGGFGFGRDAIGLLRGFSEDDVVGTRAVTVNADYRIPLARVDRGVGTIPFFMRSLHGALFVDAGQAWSEPPRWADVRTSIGAEVSLDAVIGFALPVTFTAGAAWRRDGEAGRGFVAFGRIGRAF